MKVHVLSDLHLEFAGFEPNPEAVRRADIVVLAGDIGTGTAGIEWAADAFARKRVVYVCGNHELYGQHWDSVSDLRIRAEQCGVAFLEDDEVVIEDVRILGAALWTDFCLYGQSKQDAAMHLFNKGLADCRNISASTPLSPRAQLTPALILERHERSRTWLAGQLARPFSGKTLVVTHHAPSFQSVAPRFRGDPLSPGFASDLPREMFAGADLWIHGHMHDSCDYSVPSPSAERLCSVRCNPRGYPLDRRNARFENPDFDEALILEI